MQTESQNEETVCPVCGGSKAVKIEAPIGKGFIIQHCGRCKGTGKVKQDGGK